MDGAKPDIAFKKNGYLFIVPPEGRDTLKRNFDTQERLGVDVVWLEPDELKQKFPSMNVNDIGAGVTPVRRLRVVDSSINAEGRHSKPERDGDDDGREDLGRDPRPTTPTSVRRGLLPG